MSDAAFVYPTPEVGQVWLSTVLGLPKGKNGFQVLNAWPYDSTISGLAPYVKIIWLDEGVMHLSIVQVLDWYQWQDVLNMCNPLPRDDSAKHPETL